VVWKWRFGFEAAGGGSGIGECEAAFPLRFLLRFPPRFFLRLPTPPAAGRARPLAD
jgi:hypothetical protein